MAYKTILLVEDNPDEEVLMVRALRKNNIIDKIIIARDGAEAIKAIESEDRIDVVFLDLNLPVMGGMDVLSYVRSKSGLNNIPIVILSSSKEDADITRSYQLGANSYVNKPIDFSDFTSTVKSLGAYWLNINRLPSEG
ncbi:response regulator [Desulfuribacillus alkaliarsenatis]|uniref:Response regulatory domain-containing protein n=1 Tax=Desulfuribacillus alkaliarsenatis TaxID=766136 RepID=A0A1E5FYH5_9FIRM|nr:response regulator [Desulfuribacillus alkaliarsenatis]OEF95622.1 hypothetical protein BHF68_12320 [Desulfuribacillus alkaliarsenatis]